MAQKPSLSELENSPRIIWSFKTGVMDKDRRTIYGKLGPWTASETYNDADQRREYFKFLANDGNELEWDYEGPIRKRLRATLLQKMQDFVDGYKTGKHTELHWRYSDMFSEKYYDADKDEECIKPKE
jgi:hypothetical protein